MSVGRDLYQMLIAGSQAYARWDLEASMSILKNRKKLLIVLALAVPILAACCAEAYVGHEMLGGKAAYAPSFYTTSIFLTSIAVGVAAGLITGCIGAGGGFIITPALMAVGVKGILAVGTDLFHIFAKAIMGTTIHKKLGNVSVRLALAFLIGSICGTFIGGAINKGLYNFSPILSDVFITVVYALLLGFLGFYALYDYLRLTNRIVRKDKDGNKAPDAPNANRTGLSLKLQSLHIPPMITFDQDAVPGVTTVGTDIFQIIFTAGFAAIGQYAIYGYVFYTLAVGMLLGSLLGIQIGALTTKVVKGAQIRGFYAMSILAGFVNRITTLPKKFVEMEIISLPAGLVNGIEFVGNIVFWFVVAFFGFWVLSKFILNINKLREG